MISVGKMRNNLLVFIGNLEFKQAFSIRARFGKPVSLSRFLFICVVVVLAACSQEKSKEVISLEGSTMGTTYHITLVGDKNNPVSKQTIQTRIDKRLDVINQVMSTYISDSELSLLNQASQNEWHVVSDELFFILEEAQGISVHTGGAFDVTVGPLVNLWGFGPDKKSVVPTDEQIANIHERVGFSYLELDGGTRQVRKQAEIYIDLSAIAKGYATDQIAFLVKESGFSRYMVEIGGELRVSGDSPANRPWRIGVEKPSLGHTGQAQTVSIREGGLATSGDYRNYYEDNGVRISHTIDPVTGRPITHTLASVTVISSTGAKADAMATALNVMGPDKGVSFAKKNGLSAYFIIREGETYRVTSTEQFEHFILSEQ